MSNPRSLRVWIAWLLALFAYSIACVADDEVTRTKSGLRTWVDSSGRYQVQAELLSKLPKSVSLRRVDGNTVEVPIERLSRRDQRYLRDLTQKEPGPIRRTIDAVSEGVKAAAAEIDGQKAAKLAGGASRRNQSPLDGLKDVPEKLEELVAPERTMPADIVYVQVSRALVHKLIARPIAQARAVNDRIVGRPVRGTANMTGHVNLGFVPSHDRAIIDLTLSGQIHSQTVGFGGPVQVHSGGMTTFSAVKRVTFNHRGMEVLPAQVNAETTTNIQGVSSSFRGLFGRIARKIGTRRAYALKPAAEAESAQKAEARIASEFNAQVWRDLWQGRNQVSHFAAQLPVQPRDLKAQVWFATSRNYLQVAVVRGEGRLAATAPPDPGELDRPDVVVHVHSSLVNRVIRDDELQQAIKPLVNMFFANEARRYVSSVTAANQVDVDLKQSRDGAWWTVTVRAPNRIVLPSSGIAAF